MIDGFFSLLGSLFGAGINAGIQSDINSKNANLQREFAQNSIQWKVQDAQKAGIHPLFALGAGGYQASPSYAGADVGGNVASALKAVGSMAGAKEQEEFLKQKQDLELESLALDNLAKRKQISEMGQNVSLNNIFGENGSNGGANPLSVPNSVVDGSSQSDPVAKGNKLFNVGKGMQITTWPSGNGKPQWLLQPDQGSILGGAMEDADLLSLFTTQYSFIRQLYDGAITDAENFARAKGLLKPSERFSRNPLNYTPYGFVLEIVPNSKSRKPVQYKPKSRALGF